VRRLVSGRPCADFSVTPDPARLTQRGSLLPQFWTAIRKTNLIDSPGCWSHDISWYLGLCRRGGQVCNARKFSADRRQKFRQREFHTSSVTSPKSARPKLPVRYGGPGKRKAGGSVEREPPARHQHAGRAKLVHAKIAELQPTLASGRASGSFLTINRTIGQESISSVRDAVLLGIILPPPSWCSFCRTGAPRSWPQLVIPVTAGSDPDRFCG